LISIVWLLLLAGYELGDRPLIEGAAAAGVIVTIADRVTPAYVAVTVTVVEVFTIPACRENPKLLWPDGTVMGDDG